MFQTTKNQFIKMPRGGEEIKYIYFLLCHRQLKKIDKRHGFYIIGTNNLMAEDWIDREQR